MDKSEKINQLLDRTDPKWAHPLVKKGWEGTGLEDILWEFLDPKKTYPELREMNIRLHEMARQLTDMMSTEQMNADFGAWVDYQAPGLDAEKPSVRVRVWTPDSPPKKPVPTIFYTFGGGLIQGSPEMFEAEAMRLNPGGEYAIVCPDYRLAPEFKYPANIDDLHAAYKWTLENANQLGLDSDRIVMFGESTGGHLTAALSHRLKKHGIRARAQILLEPIIDDRQMTPSSRLKCCVWKAEIAARTWQAWLGDKIAQAGIAPEAVPGHAALEDFKGLPPTFIHSMENDIDRDDCIRYAQGLWNAGVFCDLHTWGGNNHMTLVSLQSELKERLYRMISDQLGDAFSFDLHRPWTVD
ncbi:MAG: alpha/beta hydrolase [Desulfatitalea sp.]|nr:alpha/beta hydrolase [Desulfatitalea sp.]NNJ99656.1 alpha/beta hydrolase [Desulfatitalea sp.]